MTDENSSESTDNSTNCNNSNNRSSSKKKEKNKSSNNTNERIVAEAAKILLKNDFNGNNAAKVATAGTSSLLSVTSSFPLSNLSFSQSPKNLSVALLQSIPSVQTSRSSSPKSLVLKNLSASTLTLGSTTGCQQRVKILNNGFSVYSSSPLQISSTADPNTISTSNANEMAAATASANPPLAHLNADINTIPDADLKNDNSVIDYTTHNSLSPGSVSNNRSNNINNNKLTIRTLTTNNSNNTNSGSDNIGNNNTNNGGDIDRNAILSASGGISMNASVNYSGGYGGRLQFFKEGKIILELQRSNDGEKDGWVSVSRKPFRPPAATSSTVTPTSTVCAGYSKNENSTSLSFSDDNSSIQSSPWQRDHCWKQLTPRCGISKEMSLLYRKPKDVELTKRGLHLALKKRRKPFDTLLESNGKSIFQKINNLIYSSLTKQKEKLTSPEELKILAETTINDNNDSKADGDASSSSSLSSTATLVEVDHENADIKKKNKLSENSLNDLIKNGYEEIIASKDVSMYENKITSKDDAEKKEKSNLKVNGNLEEMIVTDIKNEITIQTEKTINNNEKTNVKVGKVEGTGDKRLKIKTKRIRAKLNSIIQKLIDTAPVSKIQTSIKTFSLPLPSGAVGNSHANNSTMFHKILPIAGSAPATVAVTSATTTSRLVEYHQQHVSPRKRILRQLEKFSLEDNAATVGVKRSRAKNSVSTNSQTQNQQCQTAQIVAKSSPSRTQPNTTVATQHLLLINSSVKQQKTKPITSTSPPISAAAPSRLYSSYSIHSLLSGSNGPSSSSSSSTVTKRTTTNNTAIISSSLSYQHPQTYTDPSYLRSVLASPKSPDDQINASSGGGKSPSSSANSKKRSPPYGSIMQDAHSRSPNVVYGGSIDYGRRSPRVSAPLENNSGKTTATSTYKMRYSNDRSISSPTNHSQNLYSSYMMSPKYTIPSINHLHHVTTSNISANTIGDTNSLAFGSMTPISVTTPTTYIPQTSVVSSVVSRELQLARSAASSPCNSTPRTVPKKTASIRRQFASPITANTNSMSLLAVDRESDREGDCERDRDRYRECNHTSMNLEDISAQHATTLLQRGSPLGVGSVPISSSLQYYMYPPGSGSPSSHTSVSAPSPNVLNPSVAAAVAAYIPPVASHSYFPYISTLAALRHNPMWLHYPGNMPGILPTNPPTTSSPTTRLSPPFHAFPSYNGIAAIVAAHHNMLTPASTATHSLHDPGVLDLGVAGCAQSPKLNDSGADHSTATTKSTTRATTFEETALSTLFSSNSIVKEELSSDVPLNLSKH